MPEDLVVTCDRQKLIQIMNYLIKNSIKFMGDSDSITICAEAADGETVFSVTDTGPGIPEEELSRIFERFHQVDSSATRRAGIGLSIARKMAELHGGRIRLLNIKPNGLRAEFSIPGESGLTAEEPKQPTILIIDDDQEFCVLLAHFLCKKHFRVIMANDSAAGLRLTESDRVEVILIDTRISPEDGFTLCRAICGNPKTRDIPVIMLSTVYESELIKQAIAAGARDCILRPFEFEELLAKLKACTEPPG
jgi:CheY-like chemotaxis protein